MSSETGQEKSGTGRGTLDWISDKSVTIEVGPNNTPFAVHKSLLCSHSKFFAAALNGSFKEAEEGTVKLPEEEEATFKLFIHWLYHKHLRNKSGKLRRAELVERILGFDYQEKIVDNPFDHICKLWHLMVFAERYEIKDLTDATWKVLGGSHADKDTATEDEEEFVRLTSHIYKSTHEVSRTRKYYAKYCFRVFNMTGSTVLFQGVEPGIYPEHFLLDMLSEWELGFDEEDFEE